MLFGYQSQVHFLFLHLPHVSFEDPVMRVKHMSLTIPIHKTQLTTEMPSCYACDSHQQGVFKFPSDRSMRFKWINCLGIESSVLPCSSDRLCVRHFTPADIIITPGGLRRLRVGALPFPVQKSIKVSVIVRAVGDGLKVTLVKIVGGMIIVLWSLLLSWLIAS